VLFLRDGEANLFEIDSDSEGTTADDDPVDLTPMVAGDRSGQVEEAENESAAIPASAPQSAPEEQAGPTRPSDSVPDTDGMPRRNDPVRDAEPASPASRPRKQWFVIASIGAAAVLVGALIWVAAAVWGGMPSGDDPDARTPTPTPPSTPTAEPRPPVIHPAVDLAVPAAVDWTMTGISCAEGDTLAIKAAGTILHELNPASTVTPDGLLTPDGAPDPFYLRWSVEGVPDGVATASLIGSLDKQEPFFVGYNRTYTCPRAGALFLGINDIGLEGNSGAWDVSIVKTENLGQVPAPTP
jgi:hypothetical protein